MLSLFGGGGDFDETELLSHVDNSHEIRKLLCHLLVKPSDCAYCIGVEGKLPINPKGQCHFGCIEIEWEPELMVDGAHPKAAAAAGFNL